MLRDARRLVVHELDACHDSLEVRTPSLRVGVHRGTNVATDFALVDRAAPFTHLFRRPAFSIVLEGVGRFEEHGRRAWLGPGDGVLSQTSRGGTEAYAGATSVWMVLDWDPRVLGADVARPFTVVTLRERERQRLLALATRLAARHDEAIVMASILDVLRAEGIPFEPVRPRDLDDPLPPNEQPLVDAFAAQLARLDRQPAIQDLVDATGWNERLVHRRLTAIAARYVLPWAHWRGALHHARLVTAFRLLATPRARTEVVARLTGFRSPTGLCHMFAKAGLPSPGVFAQVARRDVLDAWAPFAEPRFAVGAE